MTFANGVCMYPRPHLLRFGTYRSPVSIELARRFLRGTDDDGDSDGSRYARALAPAVGLCTFAFFRVDSERWTCTVR